MNFCIRRWSEKKYVDQALTSQSAWQIIFLDLQKGDIIGRRRDLQIYLLLWLSTY